MPVVATTSVIIMQSPNVVTEAYERVKDHINLTPLKESEGANKELSNNIFFKTDSLQRTGAFKIRGVLNHILHLKEQGKIPEKIVAFSTGNHGLAIALVSQIFNIKARIYLPKYVSDLKKKLARAYDVEIVEVDNRREAEYRSYQDQKNGYHYIHPSDNDDIIAGYGTMLYEAIMQLRALNKTPDYIFASCGGGGLLSGSLLAKELSAPNAKLIGAEPKNAGDAYESVKSGRIFRFEKSPETIADGLRALSISPRTFKYLKCLDDLMLVEEEDIFKATRHILQDLNIKSEPSSSISFAAAKDFIKKHEIKGENIIILVSGGNLETEDFL